MKMVVLYALGLSFWFLYSSAASCSIGYNAVTLPVHIDGFFLTKVRSTAMTLPTKKCTIMVAHSCTSMSCMNHEAVEDGASRPGLDGTA